MKKIKGNILKVLFAIMSILLVIPSVIYLVKNQTIFKFNVYFNFFINDGSHKILSSSLFILLFILMAAIYLIFVKNENIFKNIRRLLFYIGVISGIFMLMLPWTSSDIFYYMGVGELDSVYNQNPYYVCMKDYFKQSDGNFEDEIFIQGVHNCWSDTVVVYGPIAQFGFKVLTKLSFKNINVCLLLFKLLNLIIHILNCYLIYKISKKMKFVIIYGLNPFMFIEFIGNVHNDIMVVLFILLSLYFLIEKNKILPSLLFLSIATGIKYFTILLLPVIVLYYIRDEKKIGKRIIECVKYGAFFVIMYLVQYILYYNDINVLTTVGAQTQRYCKSLYAGLYSFGHINETLENMVNWNKYRIYTHWIALISFVCIYIIFCIDSLVKNKLDWIQLLKKYNLMLILFIISLSNFQQWYLVWLFGTIIWQDEKMIKNIICISIISEIANSIYMFKVESWKYDYMFVFIMFGMFFIWEICDNLILFLKKRKDLMYEKN